MHRLSPCGVRLLPALLTLAVAVCSSAIAGQQVLVTINPNNFPPGQNISSATPGAKLLVTTAVPNADPNAPYDQAYVLRYSPSVYAQPVDPSCQYSVQDGEGLAPCTLGGNLTIGHSAGTVPVNYPDTWAAAYAVGNCLEVMCYAEDGDQIDQVLRVNLSAPSDRVSAVIPFADSAWGWIQAFDSAGRYLGVCYGFPGMTQPPPGCTTSWVSTVIDGEGVWVQYTFASSAADISFVIVGGQEIPALPIAQVQFDSPVAIQLAGLSSKVKGAAPGTGLAIEALTAQALYDAHDIPATCAVLTGFVNQVEVLAGKRIASLTAVQLLAVANPIESALGCLERGSVSAGRDARFARPARNQRAL
jgi:hypothetical protein